RPWRSSHGSRNRSASALRTNTTSACGSVRLAIWTHALMPVRVNAAPTMSAAPRGRLLGRACPAGLETLNLSSVLLQPACEPGVHFIVEMPAVVALLDPVVLIGIDQQAALDLLALQRRPVLQDVVERHAKIPLADGHEHRGAPIRREADGVLLVPDRGAFPRRSAHVGFPRIHSIARAPL